MKLKEAFESKKLVPHNDILTGKITDNSFAVSFFSVLNGSADKIYSNPSLYFKLTYKTKSITDIFNDVLTRVSKGGARPLLIIDTTFGGGKTHTLVGIYHLFKNSDVAQSDEDIKSILKKVEIKSIPDVSLVAIDCHNISSLNNVRTLWGEIGKQLGCYHLVETFDKNLRKPDATTLNNMINSSGKPVLMIIDELVNHLKDAKGEKVEKVGDTNLAEITVSFFHTLTEVIANSKNAMLIVTLPGNESAYKEESDMLEEYKKKVKDLVSRVSAFTVPIDKSEIYDVIKRRLFEKVDENLSRQVTEELQKFYSANSGCFSDEVVQTQYYEKIKRSYPFHPVLIELIYERVSTISEFQKTRGILRLLAHVLRNIYNNLDKIPEDIIITPGIVDLNDNSILQELTNKIACGEYQSVIKTDIANDEGQGKCQRLDNKLKYGSSVRIATSVYLYTLIGTAKEESIGCSLNELVLSVSVELVNNPCDIEDYIENLENNLWYISKRGNKFYFSVEVNINKVIYDEIQGVSYLDYNPEIRKRLGNMLKNDYFDVYVWEHDVRTPTKPTLVVVNYNDIKGLENKIPDEVAQIIKKEGNGFRTKTNLMYVLVPKEDKIYSMKEASKRYTAINTIKTSKNLKPELKKYSSKINELFKESELILNSAIEKCYSLICYPSKTDTKCVIIPDGYKGAKDVPDKIYLALVNAGKILEVLNPEYIVDKIIGTNSERVLTVNEIYNYFEESPSYPMLKNKTVLYNSIERGIKDKLFGLYVGSIGDITSITQSNYIDVRENFYYGRNIGQGARDGYYVVPKQNAIDILDKLNSFVGFTEKIDGVVKETKNSSEKPLTVMPITVLNNIVISDIAKIPEYQGWEVENIGFSFSNANIFQLFKSRISMLLIGNTVKSNVEISSDKMNLSIKNAEDYNSLFDIIYKLSAMFDNSLNIEVKFSFVNSLKIDNSFVDSIKQLGFNINEMRFSSKLKK